MNSIIHSMNMNILCVIMCDKATGIIGCLHKSIVILCESRWLFKSCGRQTETLWFAFYGTLQTLGNNFNKILSISFTFLIGLIAIKCEDYYFYICFVLLELNFTSSLSEISQFAARCKYSK